MTVEGSQGRRRGPGSQAGLAGFAGEASSLSGTGRFPHKIGF
jgi:hypothetical protein